MTTTRKRKLLPVVDVSVGTQLKNALFAPVPCLIVVKVPPAPVVDDSHLKVRVSPAVALSAATFTVNVSVIPTFMVVLVG